MARQEQRVPENSAELIDNAGDFFGESIPKAVLVNPGHGEC